MLILIYPVKEFHILIQLSLAQLMIDSFLASISRDKMHFSWPLIFHNCLFSLRLNFIMDPSNEQLTIYVSSFINLKSLTEFLWI